MNISNTKTYEDNYKHKGLCMQLILQLRERGITDEKILGAINFIPRRWFLDNTFTERSKPATPTLSKLKLKPVLVITVNFTFA